MKMTVARNNKAEKAFCGGFRPARRTGIRAGSIALWLLAAVFLVSCAANPSAEEDAGTVEVPVTIALGSVWDTDGAQTKAAPPGQETTWEVDGSAEIANVDQVRIIAFKRQDADYYPVEGNEPFLYDAGNDYVVPCQFQQGNRRKVAYGTLRKIFGYEYRVIAIAYSASRQFPESNGLYTGGEESAFSLNLYDGLSFEDFEAVLATGGVGEALNMEAWSWEDDVLSDRLCYGPQLFYGYCHLEGSEDPVIKYAERNAAGEYEPDLPLTGVLYRGMAKVEVRLALLSHRHTDARTYKINSAALMADNVYTQTGLSDYDDFLSPSVLLDSRQRYSIVDFKDENSLENQDSVVFTAWMLPGKTRLAMRVRLVTGLELVPVWLNGYIHVGNVSFGDEATGIISPDVHDNVFYLQRNHKYVLRGNTELILENDF